MPKRKDSKLFNSSWTINVMFFHSYKILIWDVYFFVFHSCWTSGENSNVFADTSILLIYSYHSLLTVIVKVRSNTSSLLVFGDHI